MKRYGRANADQGWHFLTGKADQINALTKRSASNISSIQKTGQYAHAAAIVMLTPDHHISGYFYGVEFSPKDLRLGLVQASQNKIGNIGDQVLLYCYHYDPRTGKYGAVISNILKLAGLGPCSSWEHLCSSCSAPIAVRAAQRSWRLETSHVIMSKFLPLWPDSGLDHGRPGGCALHLSAAGRRRHDRAHLSRRHGAGDQVSSLPAAKPQIEGSTILEITWSIIPFFVMLTFFIWGAVIYFQERTPPADATEVYVVAKQWMWKIEHMEGQREINELHVPTGQNIKLIMTSQDVIHSFFVPAFRIKQDVLPGRYTTLWFKATKPGRYHLFCAEYCGTMHSGMGGDIVVMEPQDYAQWMAGGRGCALAGNRQGVIRRARMRHLPSFRRAGPRPQSGRHLQQNRFCSKTDAR
jgi:cytochrome c oxidase subunit II